ncbi:immunity 52 family protein [Corallococcus soli]
MLSSPLPSREQGAIMNETYHVGSYWGPRKETPEACALRLGVFLTGLRDVDPSFTQWFQTGRSRKAALTRPIGLEPAELERLVRRGKDRVVEEIGFRVDGWNGVEDDHDASGFLVTCGSHAARVSNACAVTLPSRGPNANRVVTAQVLAGLLRAAAVAWEPVWGIATSQAHRKLLDERGVRGAPRLGWVTYLEGHRGVVPPLPAPVRIENVEGRGALITLTPERFTVANPEHMALAERVGELLAGAGLMQPVSP